jgi:hypothetical protein
MAVVRCSGAVSSITLVNTGVVTTTASTNGSAIFSCSAQEATALCQPCADVAVDYCSSMANGTVDVSAGSFQLVNWSSATTAQYPISSITVNGHVYTWNTGDKNLEAVAPVDAIALISYGFVLVTG